MTKDILINFIKESVRHVKMQKETFLVFLNKFGFYDYPYNISAVDKGAVLL